MAMTFDEFVKKYKGKGINFDKAYGVQCFDLANQFNRDVVGCGMFTGLYARQIYEDFDKQAVKGYFTRIKNTPSFVPKKGDIVVWGGSLNGGIGHFFITTRGGEKKTKNRLKKSPKILRKKQIINKKTKRRVSRKVLWIFCSPTKSKV